MSPTPFTIPWISRSKLYSLRRIEPFEVSYVDRGANRRPFLVIKREDTMAITDPNADMNAARADRAAVTERLGKALAGFTDTTEKWSNGQLDLAGLETALRNHFAQLGVDIEPLRKDAEAAALAAETPPAAAEPPAATETPAIETTAIETTAAAASEPATVAPAVPAAETPAVEPPLAPVVPIGSAPSAAAPVAVPASAPAVDGSAEVVQVAKSLRDALDQGHALLVKLEAAAAPAATPPAVAQPATAPTAPTEQTDLAEIRKALGLQAVELANTRALLAKRLAEPAPAASIRPEPAARPARSDTFPSEDYNDPVARRAFMSSGSPELFGGAS